MYDFLNQINPKTESFLGYLKTPDRIVIPPYQRPYPWSKKNIQDFWNDIFSCIEEFKVDGQRSLRRKKLDNHHFLGTIYVQKANVSRNVVDLIDGQQRVTSTFLLFRALFDMVKEFREEAQDTDYFKDLDAIYRDIEVFLYGKMNEGLRLSLGSVDQTTMESLFESKIYEDKHLDDENESQEDDNEKESSGESTNSILKRNYAEIKKLLQVKITELETIESDGVTNVIPESYVTVIGLYNAIKNVLDLSFFIVVSHINTNEGSVFKMFENINTRGKQLDPIDKIKNKFFFYVYEQFKNSKEEEYDKLKTNWSNLISNLDQKAEPFIRFTLALEMKKFILNKELYDEVLNYIEREHSDKRRGRGYIVRDFVSLLNKNISIFKFIDSPVESEKPSRFRNSQKTKYKEHIIQEITYINRFELLKPTLLLAMIEYENRNIDEEVLYELVNSASNFFVNLKISGRSPKDYFTSVLKITIDYFNRLSEGESLTFNKALMEKNTGPYLSIKETISERETYVSKIASLSNFEINKILIYKIEAAMQKSNIEAIPRNKYEVEHIWPLHGDGDWKDKEKSYKIDQDEANFNSLLNRLGNLVVLESDLNKKNKNISFEKKLINFNESKRNTVENLLEWVKNTNVDFDYESIHTRSRLLAEFVVDKKILLQPKPL